MNIRVICRKEGRKKKINKLLPSFLYRSDCKNKHNVKPWPWEKERKKNMNKCNKWARGFYLCIFVSQTFATPTPSWHICEWNTGTFRKKTTITNKFFKMLKYKKVFFQLELYRTVQNIKQRAAITPRSEVQMIEKSFCCKGKEQTCTFLLMKFLCLLFFCPFYWITYPVSALRNYQHPSKNGVILPDTKCVAALALFHCVVSVLAHGLC